MEALTATRILIRGVPLEVWATLPLVIIALYVIFRWQKYGEDSFTWNHSYFKRAFTFGIGVWLLSYVSSLPPEPWQRIAVWILAAVIAIPSLDYWGGEGIFRAATIGLFLVLVGITAMPLPRVIGHFIYGDQESAIDTLRREGKARSFVLDLPPEWQEIRGRSPRTYRSARGGAGLLQLSFQPPIDGKADGPLAEQELDTILKSLDPNLKLGERISLASETARVGPIAVARYQNKEHGTLGFWLIPLSEVTVFATYTDGSPAAAEPDLREAQGAIKNADYH